MNINYYSSENPKLNELVLVHFIEKCDSFFRAKLLEYKYTGILNFQDATKKKKINSWNKIIILNKNMVAKIIDVDISLNIVQLSLLNLTNDISVSTILLQEKLLSYFNENKKLEQFIKSFCIINNYDFNNIWTNLIYYIDNERILNNTNISILKYIHNNIDKLDNWIQNCNFDNNFYINFKNYYDKKNLETGYKLISEIGIISNNNIDLIKNLFKVSI